jgi:hypothetical protein
VRGPSAGTCWEGAPGDVVAAGVEASCALLALPLLVVLLLSGSCCPGEVVVGPVDSAAAAPRSVGVALLSVPGEGVLPDLSDPACSCLLAERVAGGPWPLARRYICIRGQATDNEIHSTSVVLRKLRQPHP